LYQNNLSCYTSLSQQLLRLPGLRKEKSLCDERLDLLLLKKIEQSDQILSKPCRFQPFEPLDAVGNYPFPAWKKPATGNVQPEDGDRTKTMPTT
jgi:hypothetical protein